MENETLEQYYERLYDENANELEMLLYKRNEKIRRNIFLAIIAILLIVIVLLIIKIRVANNSMYKSLFSLVFTFLLVFGLRFVYLIVKMFKRYDKGNNLRVNDYKKLFKEKIIIPIIKKYIPDSNYIPENGLDRMKYILSGWKLTRVFESQDRIDLKIKTNNYETELVLAEVYASEEQGALIPEFHGLAGYAQLPKNIGCNIKIVENVTANFTENRFKMDMKEFEKIFEVQTNNKIVAAQILTSDVMSELVNLINSTQIGFELRMFNDILFIRFYTCEMFEVLEYDKDKNLEMIKKDLILIGIRCKK